MLKELSDQDASYLYLETAETPQHVGGLHLVELPPDYDKDFFEVYKAHVKSRMHLIPFMHSKLLELPFDVDRLAERVARASELITSTSHMHRKKGFWC